jgi:N-dimethylarginine dimethylaminohydrolase
MNRSVNADRSLAITQWESLVQILRDLGVTIELVDPVEGLPDLVFTANAGCVRHNVFVPSNFRHPQRQRETPVFTTWFEHHGWDIKPLKSGASYEGAGDALFCGSTLFAGYLNRSEIASHGELGELFSCQVLSLELVDPRFYHLDTCFCPLAPGKALYFPPAFDEYGRKVLQENIPTLIPLEAEEAARFGCNAVVVGQHVVHNAGCDRLAQALESHGFISHQTELGEFLKSGGSAKCLTLRLDGEEAAVWS